MARCSSCNKFVSNGELEIEEQGNEEMSDDRTASGTVRIYVPCGECGQELKEAYLDWEVEIDHECELEEATAELELEPSPSNMEIESVSFDPIDRYVTTDKKGKPIKARYQKHIYGVTVQVAVKCECGELIATEVDVEESASSMEELG